MFFSRTWVAAGAGVAALAGVAFDMAWKGALVDAFILRWSDSKIPVFRRFFRHPPPADEKQRKAAFAGQLPKHPDPLSEAPGMRVFKEDQGPSPAPPEPRGTPGPVCDRLAYQAVRVPLSDEQTLPADAVGEADNADGILRGGGSRHGFGVGFAVRERAGKEGPCQDSY